MAYDNVNVNVNGNQDYASTLQTYGTVVLKPNIEDNRNVLTPCMMRKKNTKYVIKWDYELADDITVPENCILEFDGGSIINADCNNYTLTGQDTVIIAGLVRIFSANINLAGTWKASASYPEWFENVDLLKCVSCFDNILLTAANYSLASCVTLDKETTIKGNGYTCINYTGNDDFVIKIHVKCNLRDFTLSVSDNYDGEIIVVDKYTSTLVPAWTKVSNVIIMGSNQKGKGVVFRTYSNAEEDDSLGIAWCTFDTVTVRKCSIGFYIDAASKHEWINSNKFLNCVAHECLNGLTITSWGLNMIQNNEFEIVGQSFSGVNGIFVDIQENTDCVNNIIKCFLWDGEHKFDGNTTSFGNLGYNVSPINRILVWDSSTASKAHYIGTLKKRNGCYGEIKISAYLKPTTYFTLTYSPDLGGLVCTSAKWISTSNSTIENRNAPVLYYYEYEDVFYICATYNEDRYVSVDLLDANGFNLYYGDQRYLDTTRDGSTQITASFDVYSPSNDFSLNTDSKRIIVANESPTTLDEIKSFTKSGIRFQRVFSDSLGIAGNRTYGYLISHLTGRAVSESNNNAGSTVLFVDNTKSVYLVYYRGDDTGVWDSPMKMQEIRNTSISGREGMASNLSANNFNIGYCCFDNNLGIPCYWQGTAWVNAEGVILTNVTSVRGTTEEREAMSDSTAEVHIGTENYGLKYYDKTLKQYVLWNGTEWTNLDGTALT